MKRVRHMSFGQGSANAERAAFHTVDDVKDTSIHSLFIFAKEDRGVRGEFCVVFARLISTLACRHTVHLRKYLRRERGHRVVKCSIWNML